MGIDQGPSRDFLSLSFPSIRQRLSWSKRVLMSTLVTMYWNTLSSLRNGTKLSLASKCSLRIPTTTTMRHKHTPKQNNLNPPLEICIAKASSKHHSTCANQPPSLPPTTKVSDPFRNDASYSTMRGSFSTCPGVLGTSQC
eukprot:5059639-Amphidinium_carterae.1